MTSQSPAVMPEGDVELDVVTVSMWEGEPTLEVWILTPADRMRHGYRFPLDVRRLANLADEVQTTLLTMFTGDPPRIDEGERWWGEHTGQLPK